MKKLLVQACCGPCATSLVNCTDYCMMFYFNGNNFKDRTEFDSRFYAMRLVSIGTIKELYTGPIEFKTCEECIRYRLRMCAKTAKEMEFDCFTTTLTVSPHKDTVLINRIGREVAQDFGIPFIEYDLKKNNGFQKTVEMSKKLGLYRQNYCGCEKSVRQ